MKKKEKYDINYEQGRCPYGFMWVDGHMREGTYVPGFCRRIKKKRYTTPEDWQ
ncbi:MAG: hypothetical protein ACYCSO_06735 [Cuniculiplasma sp.]